MASPEIENILENSDFICLLKQAPGDREILSKKLNISPLQLSFIENSDQGHGLLIYKGIILPFKDNWPKDSPLYAAMTTKPEESRAALAAGGLRNADMAIKSISKT